MYGSLKANGNVRRLPIWDWVDYGWTGLVTLVFCAFCVRFLWGSFLEQSTGVVLVLVAGAVVVGYAIPSSAIAVGVYITPFLEGCSRAGILNCAYPATIVFSALFLAATLKTPARNQSHLRAASFLINALCTWIIASFLITTFTSEEAKGMSLHEWLTPSFPFGDKAYFVTTTFLWLQGLMIFRSCIAWRTSWEPYVFAAFYTTEILILFLIQWCFDLPEALPGLIHLPDAQFVIVHQFCAPYEDIHSFGAIVVTLFALWLFLTAPKAKIARLWHQLSLVTLGTMVVISWSRITWLVFVAVVLLRVVSMLPRRWVVACFIGLLIATAGLVHQSQTWQYSRNPYLNRLASLVYRPHAANQDAGRLGLYSKAARIIAAHPLMGTGVGTFYTVSPRYATAGDPVGSMRNFAHNAMLQFAAELGVPAAIAILALILTAVARHPGNGAVQQTTVRRALIVAICTYGATQLTSNSINIYPSNQLFFWPLLAILMLASVDSSLFDGPLRAPCSNIDTKNT